MLDDAKQRARKAKSRARQRAYANEAAAAFVGHRDREAEVEGLRHFLTAPRSPVYSCQSVGGWSGLRGGLPSSGHRPVHERVWPR
jgi:hypothetical protein